MLPTPSIWVSSSEDTNIGVQDSAEKGLKNRSSCERANGPKSHASQLGRESLKSNAKSCENETAKKRLGTCTSHSRPITVAEISGKWARYVSRRNTLSEGNV